MPGQLLQEPLDGGLVTKKHATLLRPGELQQADDCVYRNFDPSIHNAPARTEFNSTALGSPSAIKGLGYLSFDFGDDLLVATVGTTMYSAPLTTITGTFAVLNGIGTLANTGDETLNTVRFGNRHYLLISGSSPRRVAYVKPPKIVVATATLSSTTILTTSVAKGFKNVIVGQSVSATAGTGTVAVGAKVLSKTSDLVIVLDTAGTNGTVTDVTFSDTAFVQADQAGMKPVTANPTVTVTSGSWSNTSDLGVGFYWFIYTEMYKPGEVDDVASGFIESGFIGEMKVGQISSVTTDSLTVTRGTIVNTVANGSNQATHWQVYMSERTADATTKPSLATFKRVGSPIDVSLSLFEFEDSALTQGEKYPSANTTITGVTSFVTPEGAHTFSDGTFAQSVNHDADRGNIYQTFGFVSSGAVNGGTLTGSEAVVGIVVQLWAANIEGSIVLKTSSKRSSLITFKSETFGLASITLGGATDTWAEAWVPTDFVNGTFQVELRGRKVIDDPNVTGKIDGIGIFVYYTGTSVNRNGVPFRTVTYRSQVGTSVTDTINLPPPIATVGDVFNGSLVLNDMEDPAILRWSTPGTADSFVKPYFMRFNTPKKDIITNIKTVGQVLVVGLRDWIKRVNYLPTELDTDPTSGLAHEDLSTDHGIVGPRAAVMFDMPSQGPLLAYVSYKGVHITDGITCRYLSACLNWETTVDLANIDSCELRVYPQEDWLVLYYAPYGTSHGKNTRALIFYYGPDKIKADGTLPVTGPMKVSARSAETIYITGRAYLVTGHQSLGKVYVEDQGLTLPGSYTVAGTDGSEAAITITPTLKTRRIYPSGIGAQAREQRIYIMVDPLGAVSASTTATLVADSTTLVVASAANAAKGKLIVASGIKPDTIITAISGTTLTMSQRAQVSGTLVTTAFSTGTVGIKVTGQDIGVATETLEYTYQSTVIGGLIVYHADNLKESFELTVSKVILPTDEAVGLSTAMRLHYFAYLATDQGQEVHR